MPRVLASCSWLKLSATRLSRIRAPTYSSILDFDFAFMAALGVRRCKQKPRAIPHRLCATAIVSSVRHGSAIPRGLDLDVRRQCVRVGGDPDCRVGAKPSGRVAGEANRMISWFSRIRSPIRTSWHGWRGYSRPCSALRPRRRADPCCRRREIPSPARSVRRNPAGSRPV